MNGFLRTQPLYGHQASRVDREANIIYGCKIIQLGRTNDDRPFVIDQGTLSQVLTFATMQEKGLKARFTHPNFCDDGVGRYLGRWRNFRREGDSIYADMHIAATSFSTPHGNLGGYVMDLAEEDPESFGVSIATKLSEQTSSAIGEWLEDGEEPEKVIPFRIQALHAADIVGDPAATRGGLFSIDSISDRRDVPHFVSQFLSTYFADADPQAVASQAMRLLSTHFGVDLTMAQAESTKPQDKAGFIEAAKPFHEAFGDQGYIYFGKGLSLAECYQQELGSLNKQIKALKAENSDLQAKLDSALDGREITGTPKSKRRTLDDTPTGQLANAFRQSR